MAATATVHHWPHSLSSPPAQSAERVEARLKGLALLKGIRISEFFKDFDPLRSGKITKAQFRRCLDQHLGLPVSDSDYLSLAGKYESTGPGDAGIMVNYRQFCETMESSFNPNITDGSPGQQIDAFHKSVHQERPNIAPELLQRTDELLQQCSAYYMARGINIKSCYQDFDRHGRGFVTQSQFHRSFPGPPEVSEGDIALLADCYCDPSTGLYNYLTFHHDVCRMGQGQSNTCSKQQAGVSVPKSPADTLQDVFKRIRDAVYQYGIRTTEFFRDHDKLRSGLITVNQFVCGLSLCVGQRAHLTRDEVAMVTRHYQTNDGRVRYKEFCDMMENAYNEPGLEKRPTANVTRPLRGHLHKSLNSLSDEEEEQLELVLERIRREVKKRQLLLYPYFRDFDRGKGFTRGVTKPQFERLLHFLSINVTPQDLKLLVNKFSDPVSGDINYSLFIQAVDDQYTGQVMEQPRLHTSSTPSQAPPTPTSAVRVDVDEVMERIRQYVTTNRVRVCENFQDFDNLRCGSISATRFRQGLNGLGQTAITAQQFKALCHRYADPDHANQILWKAFTHDVDIAFECTAEPPSKPTLLPPGAVDFTATSSNDQQAVLKTALNRLGQRVTQRRLLLSPCFQDFDKLNSGHVTYSQFLQCLAYLDLSVTPEEQSVIILRFGSAKGVKYQEFLRELQPEPAVEDKYQQRLSKLLTLNTDMAPCPPPPLTARSAIADDVMNTIKTRVSKERMRVLEFMVDYDKLRSGNISVTSFRRALDLCGFSLTNDELYALVERYGSSKDPSFVNYVKFSDDVEEIFTVKELEKTPTAVVRQFVPAQQVSCISPEEDQVLQKCMHRLAERVRVRRIQLIPLFEDYDKVHIGSVSKNQFHRVLTELELGGLMSEMEFAIIYRQFGVRVGGRTDINYSLFCAMIEGYALTRWTDPALK